MKAAEAPAEATEEVSGRPRAEVWSRLGEARLQAGLSLLQASQRTRIRRPHLEALEAGRLHELPGLVYARGHIKTYAAFLGLDPAPLLAVVDAGLEPPAAERLSMRSFSPAAPARLTLTSPALTGAGLLALVLLAGGYVVHQLDGVSAEQAPPPTAVASIPIVTPSPLLVSPSVTASPAAAASRQVTVFVQVTDAVWLAVDVDGKPVYGDSGRVFSAGTSEIFVGQRVRIASGKGAATLVTVDGRDVGPLGAGVTTREFTAQT